MYNLSFPQSFPHMSHSFTWEIKNKKDFQVTVRIWQIWLVAVKKKTETQCAKTATGVNNRKKCVTPVAVVPLPTAAQPFLHVTLLPIFFFLCLSVCLFVSWLHLSHIFFLHLIGALVSLYHTSRPVSVPLYFLSLLCLPCFIDCRLKSPRLKNRRASACPFFSVCYI